MSRSSSTARRSSRPPARRRGSALSRFFASPLWREVRTLALLATTALLLASLLTYDARDSAPLFGAAGGARDITNAAGPVGAFLAAAAFQLVGVVAYLLPLLTLLLALNRWTHAIEEGWHTSRIFGSVLLVPAATGLLHLWFAPAEPSPTASPGGMLGALIGSGLTANLHGVGASIVLLSVLALALLFTTRLTLRAATSHLVRGTAASARWCRGLVAGLLARRQVSTRRGRSARRPRAVPKPPVVNPVAVEASTESTTSRQETARPRVEPPAPREPEPFEAEQLAFSDLHDDFTLPPTSLLKSAGETPPVDEQELVDTARLLTAKMQEFGVGGSVLAIHPGPVITTYEFKPDAGVKYSRITSLIDDLSLAMKAESVRIERMAGRASVGIEVPNRQRQVIPIRDLFESETFRTQRGRLPLALGKTMEGQPYSSPLERMPHLLIAGATGAGKSVALNAMIISILFRATPAEVKFIFIDPKMLELGIYDHIPHLICPVVTNPARAARALKWACREMTRRYEALFAHGVRNLEQYNRLASGIPDEEREAEEEEHSEPLQPMPYIIIVIDELADLMMVGSKEVEAAIQRLAQMARAVGIHLIVATQRPSVDVLTGVIKANFPCRIAFRVATRTDSNVILDQKGAERLLGLGDMLFLPPGASRLIRIHGALVEEAEVRRVTAFLRQQGKPIFNEDVLKEDEEGAGPGGGPAGQKKDVLFDQAARLIVSMGQASVSHLQRRLSLGYARAARLMDSLEAEGIVGPPEGSKPRKVLVPPDYFDQIDEERSQDEERAQ